jgi:hypothetical protein
VLDKQPLAAYADREFATASRDLRGMTFVAHVRYASTGSHTAANMSSRRHGAKPRSGGDQRAARKGLDHGGSGTQASGVRPACNSVNQAIDNIPTVR